MNWGHIKTLLESLSLLFCFSPKRKQKKEKINQSKQIKTQPTRNENSQDKKKKSGVFIKMPTENPEKTEKLKNLISIFEGKIPVYLYYEDTKKYDFLGMEYLTSINEPLTKELKHIFGDENVVVRE